MSFFSTERLSMVFGGLMAVSDFSVELNEGDLMGLIGPNGAGKTTVFNMISGALKPTGGRVIFRGEEITGWKPNAITRKGIARTFQNIRLFQDLQVIEVHDCFTIAEIMVLEALGVAERGKGGQAAESGMTALGGKIPVNTSGGLKSKGHPVGATGVAQVVEIAKQLRGEAGARQVKGARVGLTQNMGGTGGSSIVHILEAV